MEDVNNKINEFFSKSEEDILNYLIQWWKLDCTHENSTIRLIGSYEKAKQPDKNSNEYGFFKNVRSLKGDVLYYPFELGKVSIYSQHKEQYQNAESIQIEVSLAQRQFRKNKNNPFILNLSKSLGEAPQTILERIEKEKFIKTIFNETGYTLRDAKNTSNALKKIAGDLYTETERFIFELLQNADDIPNDSKQVNVKFILLSKNLLFLHNGKPFDKGDVESIASIGDSTKRKDSEKTGYKGIGFKSVFTDAETVLINSGGFSFSFDKQSSLYKGKNIDEIPWEIKPIWTEYYRYPKEVKECKDFFEFPVAIDLEVGYEKINNYKNQIQILFNEPRFILFLRHIKTIEVQGINSNIKIQKIPKNDSYELLNNNVTVSEWVIKDFRFDVTQEVRDVMENDKIVPEKLKEIQKSKLSFACQISKEKIVRIASEQSYLFTYLPTNVNDYNFPFLVNADFLTTANRQSIHVKNIWNLYLFEQIGYLCVKWIRLIAQNKKLKNSITYLIPTHLNNNIEPINQHFNKGFDKAIKEIAFLPTSQGSLCRVADALVDLTGLSKEIGNKVFVKIVNPNKQLIDNSLESKDTLLDLQDISYFGKNELKQLFSSSRFQQDLNPELLLKVLKFLQKKHYKFSDINLLLSEASDKYLYSPSSLYFQTIQDNKKLLTFKKVNFLHPTINSFAEQNIEFKSWLSNIGVKVFEGATFIRQEIIKQNATLNEDLSNIQKNVNFWNFIFNNRNLLLEGELKNLANFYVVDKQKKTCTYVSECYLSDYYKEKDEPSTESIFQELGLEGYFLMTDYCTERKDLSEWRKLFSTIGIKRSENLRIFKDKLVKFIQNKQMSSENYLKITKFVFELFINNRNIFDGLDLSHFKVHTKNNELIVISSCILSDDYTETKLLGKVLPEYELPYQTDNIYLKKINNNYQNWKNFWLCLNPKVELDLVEIVKRKISIIANNLDSVTNSNVLNIWKTILDYKDELLKTHKEELKKIPLLLKNNTLSVSTTCYFPKEYEPSTAIEDLLAGYYDCFISPLFISINALTLTDLKHFFKQVGVKEKINITNASSTCFDVAHKEHLTKFDFAIKFWAYFQDNVSLFPTNTSSSFESFVQNNTTIPCLDGTVKKPEVVHSLKLKELVNDDTVTCYINLNETIEAFIGIQQRLTVSKCFQILNDIALEGNAKDKRIKQIYDDLLYRFTKNSKDNYSTEIAKFRQNGQLLSNKDIFQNVSSLFYQDFSANYLPLDDTNKIIKRIGSKDNWKKFEVVLAVLGLQNISVEDFALDSQSSKYEAVELRKTLENSLSDFAKKIDTINFRIEENKLNSQLASIKIFYSPNLKLCCSKLNYSPVVPNYYDTAENTIYYSGHWNSIANAKLVEYLFKAFDISENQISKDEFVNILLKNIPAPDNTLLDDVLSPAELGVDVGRTGRWGEKFVYQDLVCKLGKDRVNWLNKGGEAFKPYDFTILDRDRNVIYYIDAKATTSAEIAGKTVPVYITVKEWKFMQKCQDNYIVARVYHAELPTAYIKYFKLGVINFV